MRGFTDVKKSDYFPDPVGWAVDKKITAGTSTTTFSPNTNCTVAQILTFLWRAYGSPKASGSNPFSDVKSSDYFYGAALWAAEKGMVSGGAFGGDRPCTRAMAVNYMWKAAGNPFAANTYADFTITRKGFLDKYRSSSGDVVIPNGIVGIDMDWFHGRESLTSVTIPTSVTGQRLHPGADCDLPVPGTGKVTLRLGAKTKNRPWPCGTRGQGRLPFWKRAPGHSAFSRGKVMRQFPSIRAAAV